MARAPLLIRLTVVMLAVASGAATAAGSANVGDPGKRSGNTFNMISSPSTPGGRGGPATGVSPAPKSVVSNPYNVPLLQNAGSLRSTR